MTVVVRIATIAAVVVALAWCAGSMSDEKRRPLDQQGIVRVTDGGRVEPVERHWRSNLPSGDRRRVEEHLKEYGSIRSRPLMANEVLPVRYAPLKGLPMAVFHHIVEESRETGAAALMGAFNIQIVSPQHNIDLPPEAVLRTSLMFAGDREYAEIAMVLRDKAYYVAYPNQVLSDMGNAISDLLDDGGTLGKPVFEVHELSGFVFNETTVEKMPVLGVAVTINIRYGDVRVDTMFQWVGRPPSIPFNDGENFLR